MTQKQWDSLGIPMTWSIYKEGTYDKDYEEWELDLTTGAPDGVYDVVCERSARHRTLTIRGREVTTWENSLFRVSGVEVRNGEFVATLAGEACYIASALRAGCAPDDVAAHRAPFDHKFIEKMTYDSEAQVFWLRTGS